MSAPAADAIFWIAVALCTVAQLALLRSFFAGPSRPSREATATFRASETLWAVLPAAVLVALFAATWQARHAAPVQQWQVTAPAGAPVMSAMPGAQP